MATKAIALLVCSLCIPVHAEDLLEVFGHETSSATRFVTLLSQPQLRASLGINDFGYERLIARISNARDSLPTIEELSGKTTLKEQMLLLNERLRVPVDQDDEIWGMITELLPPDKLNRLAGLYLHRYGMEGILNPRLAKMLDLSDIQQSAVKKAVADVKNERDRVLSNLAKMPVEDLPFLIPNDLTTIKSVLSVLDERQKSIVEQCLAAWEFKLFRLF